MATLHLRPQALQRPELKLLYSPFTPFQLLRNFTNAALFHESPEDHPLLIVRKFVHQPKETGAMLNGFEIRLDAECSEVLLVAGNLASGALKLIGNRIGGNPDQPGSERRARNS